MSTQPFDDGGLAFPCGYHPAGNSADQQGMTLRDWFAGMALQGYNANREQCARMTHEQAAENAFRDADAMLAARKGPTQP